MVCIVTCLKIPKSLSKTGTRPFRNQETGHYATGLVKLVESEYLIQLLSVQNEQRGLSNSNDIVIQV
jgi:hypothetical protein